MLIGFWRNLVSNKKEAESWIKRLKYLMEIEKEDSYLTRLDIWMVRILLK